MDQLIQLRSDPRHMMKRHNWRAARAGLMAAGLLAGGGLAQTAPKGPGLATVLAQLDRAARRIHTVSASAVSSQYTAVVDDLAVKSGQLDFEKTSHGPWLRLNFTQPAPEVFLYRGGMGWIYQPRIAQVQKYNLKKHKTALSAFLLLGLGESGRALRRRFEIQDLGEGMQGGKPRVELNLIPRDVKVRGNVNQIHLWFDPHTWIAVRQKYFQSRGDYRLLRLAHIRINPRLNGHLFQPHFPGAKVVSPHF